MKEDEWTPLRLLVGGPGLIYCQLVSLTRLLIFGPYKAGFLIIVRLFGTTGVIRL